MTRKMNSSFPIVAQVRKGAKKEPKRPGQDLEQYLRVEFAVGAEKFKQRFIEVCNKDKESGLVVEKNGTIKVKRLRCIVQTQDIFKSARFTNEAHSAGRMVAQADDEHYISLRTGHAGKDYAVRDGQPYRKFDPSAGECVDYEQADGKRVKLKMKSTIRFDLLLPDMNAFVTFRLVSTAVYDKFRLEEQLQAIQNIADILNAGNAAGIPFFLYRTQGEIVWNKPDGSAQRMNKWLLAVQIDEKAVAKLMARMSSNAIEGGSAMPLLTADNESPVEISGSFDDADFVDDNDENVIDITSRDTSSAPEIIDQPFAGDRFSEICRNLFASMADDRSAKILDSYKGDVDKALAWAEKRAESFSEEEGLAAHIKANWPNFEAFVTPVIAKCNSDTYNPFAVINGIDLLFQMQRDDPEAFNSMDDEQLIAYILDYQK